ncbi:hypothetical protein OC846_002686 [Tilletia horrida]|uniref:Peptide hydrolase n=1 Tax=Tilletia horrida TaxID=155126 RepID=A0AAN6JYN4_9BASI|nr:hypothetical protein OC846_002686 [Tilletia horrida]KAK0566251.1 hypothetical protein OC861_003330 [Tilletia horrida]
MAFTKVASLLALLAVSSSSVSAAPAPSSASPYALIISNSSSSTTAATISAACSSSKKAARSLIYAGQYAVSPPLPSQASKLTFYYSSTKDQSSDNCFSSLQTVLPLSSASEEHLVFVAQEALDQTLIQDKTLSWTSPLLLEHVHAATQDQIKSWTWEQQMRALLGESSASDDAQPAMLLSTNGAPPSSQQAAFNAAGDASQTNSPIMSLAALHKHAKLLHLSQYWALLKMDDTALLSHEAFLPTDSRVALVSPPPAIDGPSVSGQEVQDKPNPHYPAPKFNSLISNILASSELSIEALQKDARILTAESPNDGWLTRHSGTAGGAKAADWLLAQMSQSLQFVKGAECHLHKYHPLFNPNVVCTIKADDEEGAEHRARAEEGHDEPDGLVLISAHYDSRGSFGYPEAPGGDDDGSGTTLVLAIARTIGRYRMRFARDVHIVLHSGEEQGLVGSKYYARSLLETNATVRLQLQIDMVAYRAPGEPLQLASPAQFVTVSARTFVQSLAQLYAPELVIGLCTACCSDHQSYWEVGYPATWLFERNGGIADPAYHQSYDFTNRTGYDFEQLQGATKVALATLLESAHFFL